MILLTKSESKKVLNFQCECLKTWERKALRTTNYSSRPKS